MYIDSVTLNWKTWIPHKDNLLIQFRNYSRLSEMCNFYNKKKTSTRQFSLVFTVEGSLFYAKFFITRKKSSH